MNPSEFAWRIRTKDMTVSFDDLIMGQQRVDLGKQLGDFLIAKGDGTPAYQLAVIVDDYLMGVTEVIRGCDLVPSTFRQLALLKIFGWSPPVYAHMPLMVGADGRRLAKRHGDTRIAWFRESGYFPEQIIGYLAWTLGLQSQDIPSHRGPNETASSPRPCMPRELFSAWPPLHWTKTATTVALDQLLPILDKMKAAGA